jgi:hypothetical protein
MIVDPSVVAFNAAEGWSQDVSVQYRRRLRQRCDLQLPDIPDRPYLALERLVVSTGPGAQARPG